MDTYKRLDQYQSESNIPTPATKYIKQNYNVCGQGYYVHTNGWRQNNPNDDSEAWGCHICPTPFPDSTDTAYTGLPNPYPAYTDLQEMCNPQPTVWFPKQQSNDIMGNVDATMTGEFQTWNKVKTVLERGVDDPGHIEIAVKWWTEKLTNDELSKRRDRINYPGSVEQMKQEILNYTNPKPPCPAIQAGDGSALGRRLSLSTPQPNYSTPACSNRFITDIITDQYEPWSIHHEQLRDLNQPLKEFDFSVFNRELGPPNSEFESCLNDIFTDNSDYDEIQINQLKQSNWRSYSDENYAFIRRKLQMFLDHSNDKRIMDCMGKYLYLDDTICKVGVTQHMVKIAEILFYIIGYDPNFTVMNESDRRQLEQLIIRLGNYVPRVLDRIIEISDMYEKQYCRGEVSHATHVLRTAYDKMFQVEHPMVSFSNPFSTLVSDSSPEEFNRATILGVLGIAFLKYF